MSITESGDLPTPGVIGAKRVSFRQGNPRELLQKLVMDHPSYGDAELLGLFQNLVLAEGEPPTDHVSPIIEYYFTNNLRALRNGERSRPSLGAQAKAVASHTQSTLQSISAAVDNRVKSVLLAMVLPNGKRVGDCTGSECKEHSLAVGAWLARVADHVGPDKIVGDEITEKRARELYLECVGVP